MGSLRAARHWLVAILACLALLAASGAWLSVRYRPAGPDQPPREGGGWVGDAHHILAVALYILVAGLVVVLIIAAARRRPPHRPVAGVLAAMVAATLVARTSGAGLPWSVLGPWAVRARSRYEGVWTAAFDPVIRFVVADGEVEQAEYRARALLHVVAAPALLLVATLLCSVALYSPLWRGGRGDRQVRPGGAGRGRAARRGHLSNGAKVANNDALGQGNSRLV